MFLSIDILEKIFLLSSPLLWVHACASILFVLAGIIVAYLYTNATRYYATEDMVCRGQNNYSSFILFTDY